MLVSWRVPFVRLHNFRPPNYGSVTGIGNRVTTVTWKGRWRARIDARHPGANEESQGTQRDGAWGRPSVDDFNRYAKHVPHVAFGTDVSRFRRIGLELSPQPQDLHVDRSIVNVVAVQARHVEELVTRKNAIRRPQ